MVTTDEGKVLFSVFAVKRKDGEKNGEMKRKGGQDTESLSVYEGLQRESQGMYTILMIFFLLFLVYYVCSEKEKMERYSRLGSVLLEKQKQTLGRRQREKRKQEAI